MSAYALLARAWGAEVAGWDRVETPYLEHLDGIEVTVATEPPAPPAGWRGVVSTAFAGKVAGRPACRAARRARRAAAARSSSPARTGRSTTSAMIAFCLDRLGLDPAFLIGGDVPQLGGNAAAGEGWLVVEGDESDRSVASLRPRDRRLAQRRPRPSHDVRLAGRGRRALRDVARPRSARRPRRGARAGRRSSWPSRASTTAATPRPRSRRSSLPASQRAEAERALVEFRGVGRRLERKGEARRRRRLRQLRAPSRRASADRGGRAMADAPPEAVARAAARALPAAPLLADACTSRRARARARGADAVCVTDVYPAREEPLAGVSGRLVVDALAHERPGMRIGWTPSVEEGRRPRRRLGPPGDTVLTLGAGDVDRAAAADPGAARVIDPRRASSSRASRRSAPAGRRVRSREPEIDGRARRSCSRWAAERGLAVATVGLGSNLLVADDGVDALVLRLAGELAAAEVDGECCARAAAPRTPSACTARARPGSAGSSSPARSPAPLGGGVRMNARRLRRRLLAGARAGARRDADGAAGSRPAELGLSYRHSELRARPGGRSGPSCASSRARARRSRPRCAS